MWVLLSIHKQLIAERDKGKAVLLVSLELDEVLGLSDRILVLYEGEIVGELDPKKTDAQELGLYMSGAKRMGKEAEECLDLPLKRERKNGIALTEPNLFYLP